MLSLFDPKGLCYAGMKLRDRFLHDRDAVIRVRQLFLAILSGLAVNKLMSQHLRLILGLVEALNAIGLLVVFINLLSLERSPTSSILKMTCEVHRALFSPTPPCSACFEELERINVAQQFDRVVDGDEFSKARRQPATRTGSLLECAALDRSSQCGTRLPANQQRTCGPYRGVRLLAAPRSVRPATAPTQHQNAPTRCALLCASWPSLRTFLP